MDSSPPAPGAARDPYLPAPTPSDNPPEAKASSPKRTIVVWLVLVVLFVGLYQFFSTSTNVRAPEPHDGGGAGVSLMSWLPFVICCLIFFWMWRQIRGSRVAQRGTNEAVLLLADGDLEGARQRFADMVAKQKGSQYVHTSRVNLAWVLQRLGRFDEEREVLLTLERTPGLLFASEHRMYAAVYLARHFALRGDVARAEPWLADAQLRRQRMGNVPLFMVAQLRMTEALLLARRERDAEALTILEKDWQRFEAALPISQLKPTMLLRAYLTARTGGPRHEGMASPWVAKAKPMRSDEVSHLWAEWPALRAWAEAHDLTQAPSSASASG